MKDIIEKAAEEEYPTQGEDSTYCDLGLIQQDAFKAGAKWQAERMYSKEEIIDLLLEYGYSDTCFEITQGYNKGFEKQDIAKWLEQLKQQ